MDKTFRAFFAIDLSAEIKDEIISICKKLKNELDLHKKFFNKIRFTKPENFHITLRFLGNISENQLKSLTTATQKCNSKNFKVKLANVILFPSIYRPRMLVVNLEPNEPLKKIWQFLDDIALKNKIAPDNHPFTPHLTLCRFECKHKFPEITIPKITITDFTVDAIKLYRSDPSDTGSNYTLLETFMLS